MRLLFFIATLVFILYGAKEIYPDGEFIAKGDVQDIVVFEDRLFAATIKGSVDIFDLKSKEKIDSIEIPEIEDFKGEKMSSKIYSLDIYEESVVFASEGEDGYRNLWLYRDEKLVQVLDKSSRYFISRVRFIDSKRVLLALLSNEILVLDLESKDVIYKKQLSSSSFSDLSINEDKTLVASSDESGVVRIIESRSGKVIETYEGKNVDRVFSVDFKRGVVLTAGQDRRAAIYGGMSSYYLEFDFLLYSCALSPSSKLGAVAYNEMSDIIVFKLSSKDKLYDLKDAKATVTKILFLSEDEVIASSDSSTINYYKLK